MALPQDDEPMILVHGLHKQFGTVAALKGVDLSVARGEVVCLIGPSGSGKSTVLRSINFLERPSRGEIFISGRQIGLVGGNPAREKTLEGRSNPPGAKQIRPMSAKELAQVRSEVGMVFQMFYLWPHLSALENVILGLTEVRGMPLKQAATRGADLLAKVGLAAKLEAYPEQLSGGQRQRVAIARALAMEPKVMLFDEPTSALDPERVGEVLDTMAQIAAEGMTMVIATHEMGFARQVAHRVVFMDEGRVVESGPPQAVFDHPQTERLKRFLDKILP